MKKLLVLLLISFSFSIYAQEDAWVYFNGKPESQNYIDNPLTMLTQRALDRRTAQSISIDIADVPVDESYILQIQNSVGITVKAKSKWMNAVHVRGSISNINALTSLPFVASVSFANRSLNVGGKTRIPKENKVSKVMETATVFPYGNSANQIEMLSGNVLHEQNFTGSGKIIAVIDAGFPGVDTGETFARLRANNLILGGYDFVNRSDSFYSGDSHGTLVLSTMGGYIPNKLVGTAPDAAYYLFISEDVNSETPLEESLWVEAVEEADRLGVDVINTSLGYTEFDNPTYSYNFEEMDGTISFASRASNFAYAKGMIVVVAAGNEGATFEPHIGVPADAQHVLTVGSVTSAGDYSSFSSIGYSFDGRVKPDVVAQGTNAVVAFGAATATVANGTSFSSPIMCGLVASLWQALPTFSNEQIMQLIKESASQFANPDEFLGYGIPDFDFALSNSTLSVTTTNATDFKIYPNPVSETITISSGGNNELKSIVLFNIYGQSIYRSSLSESTNPLDLSNLASGIYIYKIESKNGVSTGKLQKK